MNKLQLLSAVCTSLVFISVSANAATIQDRPEYRPSTDIYLDDVGGSLDCAPLSVVPAGSYCQNGRVLLGNTATSGEFQFNLEYDTVNDAAIEVYDDNDGGLTAGLNWGDADHYGFNFSGDGTSDVWTWAKNVVGTADWTISGWEHTPFSGDWIDNDASTTLTDGDFLALAGYHSFPGEAMANGNEVWDTTFMNTEVLGYTYRDIGNNGTDTWLEVEVIPVPAAAWLFGSALGLLGWMRKRKTP